MIPSTVEGTFRARAVDSADVRDKDVNKRGLKKEAVAKRCVTALDNGEKVVLMPVWFGRGAHTLYWLFPGFVEKKAAKKYGFTAQ